MKTFKFEFTSERLYRERFYAKLDFDALDAYADAMRVAKHISCELYEAMLRLEYDVEMFDDDEMTFMFDIRERRLRKHTRIDMLCIYSHSLDDMLVLFEDVNANDAFETLKQLELDSEYKTRVYDAIYDMMFCDISYSDDTHILTITIDWTITSCYYSSSFLFYPSIRSPFSPPGSRDNGYLLPHSLVNRTAPHICCQRSARMVPSLIHEHIFP